MSWGVKLSKIDLEVAIWTFSSSSLSPNNRALKLLGPYKPKPFAHYSLIYTDLSLVSPSIKISSPYGPKAWMDFIAFLLIFLLVSCKK